MNSHVNIKLCIFLNGLRGVSVLKAVATAGYDIAGVFVSPAFMNKPDFNLMSAFQGMIQPVENPNNPSFLAALEDIQCDLGIVAGFSTIFSEDLISVPQYGMLNLHAGRLPEYRGGSPLNWQIINGEKTAGISVLSMDAGIDTGNVMAAAEIPIGAEDTIATLHERANAQFPDLTVESMEKRLSGDAGIAQDDGKARYWHQRNDGDGRIDWRTMTAVQVLNLIRGVTRPYPGAYSSWQGTRVRIYWASLAHIPVCGVPGRTVYIQNRGPYVICADQAVLLEDYVVEGDKARIPNEVHFD